jgi:hypothetical protein
MKIHKKQKPKGGQCVNVARQCRDPTRMASPTVTGKEPILRVARGRHVTRRIPCKHSAGTDRWAQSPLSCLSGPLSEPLQILASACDWASKSSCLSGPLSEPLQILASACDWASKSSWRPSACYGPEHCGAPGASIIGTGDYRISQAPRSGAVGAQKPMCWQDVRSREAPSV